MHEIELKFQIGERSRSAVEAAVTTASAQRTRLQAIYFDTDDRALASAGSALRLRKEGRHWVQTLKASAAHAMQRLEHNVTLVVRAGEQPAIDVQRHAGTPAGELLVAALSRGDDKAHAPALRECFRTDIRRTHRALRASGGKVELAFDAGIIQAKQQVVPVCELEIELLHGQPGAVIDVAKRWVARHELWLDVRTKAARGDQLARGEPIGEATKARSSPWRAEMGLDAAMRAALRECLAHILPNTGQIASGAYAQDHVHQARVGMRRLRSLLRFAPQWSPEAAPAWDEVLGTLAAQLGAARDQDVFKTSLEPALRAAGAPAVQWPALAATGDPVAALRARATNLLLLELLASVEPTDASPATPTAETGTAAPSSVRADDIALSKHAARRLRRWHQRVVDARTTFAGMSDEARHTLRKHAKRLRYAAEFAAPLYPAKAFERYLARLRPLQECLGNFNDLSVARLACEAALPTDARAWFALGWIAARREVVLAECGDALRKFAKVKPFWTQG